MNRFASYTQAVGALMGGIAAVLLASYTIVQLNFAKGQYLDYKRERDIQKMDSALAEWNSMKMLAARAEAARQHPKSSEQLLGVYNFFERLGISYAKHIVSLEEVDDYFRDDALFYWCGWEDWRRELRKSANEDPDTGSFFENYQHMVADLKKAKKLACPTSRELKRTIAIEQERFWREVDTERKVSDALAGKTSEPRKPATSAEAQH
jgi:hypothetical protein